MGDEFYVFSAMCATHAGVDLKGVSSLVEYADRNDRLAVKPTGNEADYFLALSLDEIVGLNPEFGGWLQSSRNAPASMNRIESLRGLCSGQATLPNGNGVWYLEGTYKGESVARRNEPETIVEKADKEVKNSLVARNNLSEEEKRAREIREDDLRFIDDLLGKYRKRQGQDIFQRYENEGIYQEEEEEERILKLDNKIVAALPRVDLDIDFGEKDGEELAKEYCRVRETYRAEIERVCKALAEKREGLRKLGLEDRFDKEVEVLERNIYENPKTLARLNISRIAKQLYVNSTEDVSGIGINDLLRAEEKARQYVERITELFEPLRKTISKKMIIGLSTNVSLSEIFQVCYDGLRDGLETFHPEKGKGATYLGHRMRGAVFDYLRNQDFVPRLERRRSNALESYMAERGIEEKDLDYEEAAEVLKNSGKEGLRRISPDKLREAHEGGKKIFSLDFVLFEDNDDKTVSKLQTLEDDKFEDPQSVLETRDLVRSLMSYGKLSQRDRIILKLYYGIDTEEGNSLTMKEIGELMGISESRVCQNHTKIMKKLRKYVEVQGIEIAS